MVLVLWLTSCVFAERAHLNFWWFVAVLYFMVWKALTSFRWFPTDPFHTVGGTSRGTWLVWLCGCRGQSWKQALALSPPCLPLPPGPRPVTQCIFRAPPVACRVLWSGLAVLSHRLALHTGRRARASSAHAALRFPHLPWTAFHLQAALGHLSGTSERSGVRDV